MVQVKWHEFERVKEANKIIESLKEQSEFVTWFNDTGVEYFGLIAKKMAEEVKAALRNDVCFVFDRAELKTQNRNIFGICIGTMKMQDTRYKIPEGVNTISGVCESADTKQNISLGRKKIRNFIKAVEYAL